MIFREEISTKQLFDSFILLIGAILILSTLVGITLE